MYVSLYIEDMNSIDITKLYLDYNYICTLVHVCSIIYIEDMNSKDITKLIIYALWFMYASLYLSRHGGDI